MNNFNFDFNTNYTVNVLRFVEHGIYNGGFYQVVPGNQMDQFLEDEKEEGMRIDIDDTTVNLIYF